MTGFVVDADIAKSSGETEHPVSKSSRTLLEMISSSYAQVCFYSLLLAEWKKHESNYSRKWKVAMYSRKKINILNHNDETKAELILLPESKKQKAAIKDSHLIDISKQSSKIIFSNDVTAKNAFSTLLSNKNTLDGIYWLSPLTSLEDIETYVIKKKIIPEIYLLKS